MADQINVNAIANTLQTKVDLPDSVSQSQCDFVIAHKTPTAQDPTWYRLYKSGWVEQGGRAQATGATSQIINFPITMQDTNYSFQSVYDIVNSTGSYNMDAFAGARSVSSMIIWTKNGNGAVTGTDFYFFWEIKGQGAQ